MLDMGRFSHWPSGGGAALPQNQDICLEKQEVSGSQVTMDTDAEASPANP